MNLFKQEIIKILKSVTHLNESEINNLIEIPPSPDLGDYSFPCFILSKELTESPQNIAINIANKIRSNKIIDKIQPLGPYLNFYINKAKFAELVLKKIKTEKEKYGSSKKGKGKRVVIEFPAPNTNKPLHIGHLRNLSIGESLARIHEFQSYKLYRVNLNNDRGIHICKSMLAYKKWGKNKKPNKKSDHFIGDFYVLFSQKAKQNTELDKEAQDMLLKWEKKDPETRRLWKKMNSWALKGFDETYKLFKAKKFDKIYNESEIYTKGKNIVIQGLKKKIFKRDKDNSIFIDLGNQLGKKILLRGDGTTIYITQDLYLACLKYKNYKFHKSLYIVGNEQNYHFQVLFKILELLKYKFAKDCYHVNHGMVNLPEGKIKSREGKVVDADDLIEEITSLAKKEIQKRDKTIKQKELAERSLEVALAAIKYYLLKFDLYKDIKFNPEESISFEGNTGPYIQYTYARTSSILRKIKNTTEKVDFSLLNKKEEQTLVYLLSKFPETIEEASSKLKPNLLATYAYEISQAFNEFYHSCPVLTSEQKLRNARIYLLKSFLQVLKNTLTLLNIKPLEKM